MGNCLTILKGTLVKYVLGKGILSVIHLLVLRNVSGSIFQKKLSQIYHVVLSNLLHSMVPFAVACSLLLCSGI